MKKSLLAFLFAGTNIVNAQITFTQNDVAGVGKICLRANDTIHTKTAGGINPGTAGANQTWAFPTLAVGHVDTLTFTNPNWTPAMSSFPTANLAMKNSTDTSIAYISNTASGLFILGIYADVAGNGTFQPVKENLAEEVNSFPDTYNSAFSNTSKLSFTVPYTKQAGVDSIKVKQTVVKNIKTDGWGNLTTPLGTFSTLRSSGKVITFDTILAHVIINNSWVGIATTLDTVKHFSWVANNIGYSLLEFDSTKADTIKNITWLKATPTINSVNELSLNHNVFVYPNPAISTVNFEIKNADASSITLFNIAGERIAVIPINKSNHVTYNVDVLAEGIYFYNLLNTEGIPIDRGKIAVVR